MSNYSSSYDQSTVTTALPSRIRPSDIGLVSEAIHPRRDKWRWPSGTIHQEGGSESSSALDSKTANGQVARKDSAYVEMADELVANGHAEPTDREAPTHELAVEDEGICRSRRSGVGVLMKPLPREKRKSVHRMMRKGASSSSQ